MSTKLRVLLVEDSAADADLVLHELGRAGYDPEWKRVETETDYVAQLDQGWEIILADYKLPEFDCLRALQLLRGRDPNLPFIIVSGTIGEDEAVEIMKAGANNHVSKEKLERLSPIVQAELRDAGERRKHTQAAEELRASEERFRQLVENIREVYWIRDRLTRRILYISPACEMIWGRTAEEVYRDGMSITDDVHPEDKERISVSHGALYEEGRTFDEEYRVARPVGSVRWVRARIYPVFGQDGKVTRDVGIAEDITDRKQAEEIIHSLAKFPSENPGPILRIALDGTLLYINPAGMRLLPEWHLQVGQASPPKLREAALETMNSETMPVFDLEHGKRLYSFYVAPIVASGYANLYGRDITERKRAELELLEAKALFETVVEHIPLMIFLKEATDLKFVIFNRAGEELLGHDRKALLGKNNLALFPPEQAAHFMAKDREALAKRGVVDIPEEFIQTAKKGVRLLHTRKVSLMGSDGTTKYLLGISEDITESKKIEVRLRETLDGLGKALTGIFQVLSALTEKRDPYTAGHQRRVADLARAIGREMGLAVDRVEGLRLAGTIHDMGKIAVPSEILSKPTRLTEIEFNLIKVHPQVGYDILGNIDFSWPIATMILQHHERMNGSGYPAQLKGEEILLEARILAVSDVVEAMASHRPYRPALGIEAALAEIEKNKGILYDSEVASACLALFREKGFKFA